MDIPGKTLFSLTIRIGYRVASLAMRLGREVYFEGGSQEVTWRGGVELIFNGE